MGAMQRNKGFILPLRSAPHYGACDQGKIYRIMPALTRAKCPYEIKGGDRGNGYQRVKLMLPDGTKRSFAVHRLVCEAFHGLPPSPKHHAAHWDGNQRNNRPENLRWATAKENVGDDRIRHGRTPKGERNGRAKLTALEVFQARKAYTGKHGQISQLAREFGLSKSAMASLIKGERWND